MNRLRQSDVPEERMAQLRAEDQYYKELIQRRMRRVSLAVFIMAVTLLIVVAFA